MFGKVFDVEFEGLLDPANMKALPATKESTTDFNVKDST